MSGKRDYYEVLGVPRDASPEGIKKAYRRLARTLHPDQNRDDPQANEKFKDVVEAYQVLSDPEKRARYDHFGHEAPGGFDINFADLGLGDFFDMVFGTGFGRASPRPRATRGSDLRFDLQITLEEVYRGSQREIEVPRLVPCSACQGTGSADRRPPEPCSACHGTGERRQTHRTPFGQLSTVTACPACGGTGEVFTRPCQQCRGAGMAREAHRISVTIPKGIESGERMRLAGYGDAGEMGGPPGDLYLVLMVAPHPLFERRGSDLATELQVTFAQAALGATVSVPTLDGQDQLEIPASTQTSEVLTLRGKGLPRRQRLGSGDIHYLIRIVTPTSLTKEESELLRRFAGLRGETGIASSARRSKHGPPGKTG